MCYLNRLYELFTESINIFIFTLEQQGRIFFLNISGNKFNPLDKENVVETIDFLWNIGREVNLIYFIALNAIVCVKI